MSYTLYAFGSNGESQLGLPAADIVDVPTPVPNPPALRKLRNISSGDNHTLLHLEDGRVYGVGDNRKGQLVSSPQSAHINDIPSCLSSFEELRSDMDHVASTCESTAFIKYDKISVTSSIYTFGSGPWGELGRGMQSLTNTRAISSVEDVELGVKLPGKVASFTAGTWHYVVVMASGAVYAWGKSRHGQLGTSLTSAARVHSPTLIPTSEIPFWPVQAVCGKDFTVLFGKPENGESVVLGSRNNFAVTGIPTPNDIAGWVSVHATWHAVFVLLPHGKLRGWGHHRLWALVPPRLPMLKSVVVGSEHILCLTKSGRVLSWGWGKHGNCGNLEALRKTGGVKAGDIVSGTWNEVELGRVDIMGLAAGFCTSFVVVRPLETQ